MELKVQIHTHFYYGFSSYIDKKYFSPWFRNVPKLWISKLKPRAKWQMLTLKTSSDFLSLCDWWWWWMLCCVTNLPALVNDHLCAGLVELLPQLPLMKDDLNALNVLSEREMRERERGERERERERERRGNHCGHSTQTKPSSQPITNKVWRKTHHEISGYKHLLSNS